MKTGTHKICGAWLAVVTSLIIGSASAMSEELPRMVFRSFWHTEPVNRQFAEAGVRLVHIYPANTLCSLNVPYTKYPPNWLGPGHYDWTSVDRQINDIIAWNPKAKIVCMIDLNTPPWWIASHDGADSFRNLGEMVLRKDYCLDVDAYLVAFLRHTETNHRTKIAAYMLSAGGTCEWFHLGWRQPPSDRKLAAFRKWLGNPEATVSDVKSLMTPSRAPFFHPQLDAVSIAYWRFSTAVVADRLLECAKRSQEIIRHRVPLGAFYGYVLELRASRLRYDSHLDYERVFSSPDLDFFVSPTSYQGRQPGGADGVMMLVDSLRLRGKQAWLELDHRTYLVNDPSIAVNPGRSAIWKGHKNETETIGVLRRGFAATLIYGMPMWWFDMFGGWYDSPVIMAEIARMQQASNQFSARSRSHAEVAVLVDEDSMWYLGGQHASLVLRDQRAALWQMGTPCEFYSTLDLPKLDLSRFKLVFVPNLVALTPEKRRWLQEKVCRDGRHVVWGFGSGIISDGHYDVKNIEKLIGIPVDSIRPLSDPLQIKRKQMDGWTSIYASRPNIPADVLRSLARAAGVHVYSDAGDALYANDILLAVHSAEGGKRTFTLPRAAQVIELFSGRTVSAQPTKQFTDTLPTMSTHLYQLLPICDGPNKGLRNTQPSGDGVDL